ncbi:uncharacterized protein LOC127850708 [Dreissena polymorpha]|uniref:uncharacterized protein LOC127850708 n=1 Tax=Dreissena polymorpha TaxID=45954 RepID=UPI0022642D8B|nr:uncharacterized protein LOC127850708 [Dreissena polymorpha]
MGGSGKPEKSTRESQSNIETFESCKTLRRDAESEPVAILKASSRSVGLSGVPRTPSKFSADHPKDPGLSLSRTRNGSYTTSGGTPQEHGVSLENIPKPSVSSNRTPDGPIVSSNKTPQNLSDYWSRQSPLAESLPRLRSNRKSLFNIKECLGKSSQSTPVRKRSRSHDCPEQTGNLTSENLPESPFPSTSSDSKSPSSRKWPETNHSKDQTTSEALNASVIPKSACKDVIQTPSKTLRRQNGKSSINDIIISCKKGNTYMQFETSAHLLHGRRLTGLPYSDAKAVGDSSFPNVTRRDITQRAQAHVRLIEQYRHRWAHEYLTSLREFQTKDGNNHQTIRLGDVVIVQDDFKPRLQWTLAVVDELLTGNDGLTRAERLGTSSRITTRPIVKLYPLEVHCDDN